ncbi:hypothetical protein AKJ09_09613 [Labilithrix luteola]|uniref:Uncharacterized protein n=1 Tax=Labilithrix luteola TaxID=1391654 RepID=A0A0K1QBZ0_9BACT|nr:hypothetical protein AKJ09_09613 [Labilithrix luteola]
MTRAHQIFELAAGDEDKLPSGSSKAQQRIDHLGSNDAVVGQRSVVVRRESQKSHLSPSLVKEGATDVPTVELTKPSRNA